MLNPFKSLVLVALLSSTTLVSAQEAAAPADDATATEAPATEAPAADAPAADAAADLNMGTEVATDATATPEEAAVGTPYVREEFGDWALRCLKAEEGTADPCQLYQLLNDDEGNSVAEISMFPLENGGQAAAGATIVVPLETLLSEQLQITVDGSSPRRYPFTFCNRAGCVARVGFTQAEVDQFKRGSAATLRMVPAAAPDQEVTLPISLSGFTAGYTASGE